MKRLLPALLVMVLWLAAGPAWAGCDVPGGHQPYSPALLLKTYECVRAAYDPSGSVDYIGDVQQPMEDAGVQALLTGNGGLTAQQRTALLSDYGLWLTAGGLDNVQAARVLQAAVQLDAKRAAIWLALGDTYVALLQPEMGDDKTAAMNLSWAGKQQLTREALDAYHHYMALDPTPVPHVQGFLALNILNAPTDNVCKFVAAFATAGREAEIDGLVMNQETVTPIDLLGNGVKFYVSIVPEGMHYMSIMAIKAKAGETSPPDLSDTADVDSDVDFSALNLGVNDKAELFPMKNSWYAVSDRLPKLVLQPNHGVICKVGTVVKSSLSVGATMPICDKFLYGIKLPAVPPDPAEPPTVSVASLEGQLSNIADVDLQNDGKSQTIAFLNIFPGASECDSSRLVLIDKKTKSPLTSKLNDTLAQLPRDCVEGEQTSNQEVIRYQSQTYLETDHNTNDPSDPLEPGEAAGIGIYQMRHDALVPVCVIHNDSTYAAE